MFRKKKNDNQLDPELLSVCTFYGRANSGGTSIPFEDLAGSLAAEAIAEMKNINPRVNAISQKEAEAEDTKTVIALRTFATHADGRLFSGKDVYMKVSDYKWVQMTKAGRANYTPGSKYIPNARIGFYTLKGEMAVIEEFEHEHIVFLRKDK